ncbi:hypothetical protein GOP47_0007645 [Adiantum capillus-veneris]|uniref:Ethylene insensitive 3-like DNA-binding domain-containing protein n=1 Tax=Adiantum capillus-veneris TaxID=13818 RepID=A0A9D4V135_ADICA|nr:hypothetical protein GOP47_0007645 [Adiantum capillus-veneris]
MGFARSQGLDVMEMLSENIGNEDEVSDEEIDMEELEKRMWKDRIKLRRMKEKQKTTDHAENPRQRQSQEQARRKKMSRAQDGILKYMLKMMEVCKAQAFVYGVIPEKGKPVSGASDNIRAWWKEKVRFDRNGPAAIAKSLADQTVQVKVQTQQPLQPNLSEVLNNPSGGIFLENSASEYDVDGYEEPPNADSPEEGTEVEDANAENRFRHDRANKVQNAHVVQSGQHSRKRKATEAKYVQEERSEVDTHVNLGARERGLYPSSHNKEAFTSVARNHVSTPESTQNIISGREPMHELFASLYGNPVHTSGTPCSLQSNPEEGVICSLSNAQNCSTEAHPPVFGESLVEQAASSFNEDEDDWQGEGLGSGGSKERGQFESHSGGIATDYNFNSPFDLCMDSSSPLGGIPDFADEDFIQYFGA